MEDLPTMTSLSPNETLLNLKNIKSFEVSEFFFTIKKFSYNLLNIKYVLIL